MIERCDFSEQLGPHLTSIWPLQVASVSPNFCTRLCHRSDPLSLRNMYLSSFWRRCNNNLRFLLFALSIRFSPSYRSASKRIFAVSIPICTSEDPTSGPARGVGSEWHIATSCDMGEGALGFKCWSVLCRPNVSIMRWTFILVRSLLLELLTLTIRFNTSTAFLW